jgi:hypothetical protein
MAEVVQIPSLLQHYRLIEELYRAPASVAWRAEHLATGLSARVTIVAPPPRASREAVESICTAFRRALERAGAFSGPDILPYDGAAEHEEFPCAVTLLPEGTFLSDAMALEEPVSVPRVMQIGSVIGHALARLHDAGLWHGYLHPANILLVADERPALLDHLIHAAAASAAWQAGLAVSGSPYVGVGERAFREQDPHVDVYALASLLLRILTGRSPERLLMEQIEQTLPQALPTSLRQDLIAALNIGGQSRPPTARTLAVHLSFDVAWLRATAELGPARANGPTAAEAPPGSHVTIREEAAPPRPSQPSALGAGAAEIPIAAPAEPHAVGVDDVSKGSEQPSGSPTEPAGVGGAPSEDAPATPAAAAPAGWEARPVSPREALANPALHPPIGSASSRRSPIAVAAAVLLLLMLPAGYLLGRNFDRPDEPANGQAVQGMIQGLVYEVLLGPYPDRASATDVQRSIARQWPDVWVTLESGQSYVHVLSTLYIDKAQRLVERFQQQGSQARIRPTTRDYSPR